MTGGLTIRLILGDKDIGFRWIMVVSILLTMLSAFSCAALDDSDEFDIDDRVTRFEGDSCKLKTGESGVCKRIDACQPYTEGLRKGTIQYSFLVRCSFIGFTEVICCPQTEVPNKTGSRTDTTNKSSKERPSQTACTQWKSLDPSGLTFNILDGVPVPPGMFAHMGALIQPVQSGGASDFVVRCGSSLINERFALTAAHCVSDELLLPTFVRFGVVVWNSEEFPALDVEIERTFIHPDYRSPVLYHDIALLRLRQKVDFTLLIRPACLFSDETDIDSDTPLVVIGWGVTNVETRARSDALLMTNVTTVPLNECNSTHVKFGVSRNYIRGIGEGQYCAFDPKLKMDACEADSGGPLQLFENNESTIIGIVSFGQSCASALPAVYTRVGFYLGWIESVAWAS